MPDNFKDFIVWKKSFKFFLMVHRITDKYPENEKYVLTQQMRRASASIPANIGEGHGRRYLKDFTRFVSTSIGSCNELGTSILMSKELSYLSENEFQELNHLYMEVSKMLFGLRKSLGRKACKK